ncbi:hypothetical protein L873DRAFT_1812960 [Choiromyces venosus 120613-1]|uniref:Uncharacterized protein n=1 Tax=Choiromyces venosus 120613-1 TaxID=1336337 RepID=A0A3N4JAI4_9PEZI|nr:hypothetical protein L873DRAFT_1812960 [Choiromyces venosus 120613-1]
MSANFAVIPLKRRPRVVKQVGSKMQFSACQWVFAVLVPVPVESTGRCIVTGSDPDQEEEEGGREVGERIVCKPGLPQLCAARNMTTTASPAVNPPLPSSSSVIPSFPPFLALPGSPHPLFFF